MYSYYEIPVKYLRSLRHDVEEVLVGNLLFEQQSHGVLDVNKVIGVGAADVHQQNNTETITARILLLSVFIIYK